MLSQRRISLVRSLHRKKERQRRGTFLVEGLKSVRELLDSEFRVSFVAAVPERLEQLPGRDDVEFLQSDREQLDRVSSLQNPEGVLAVAEIPQRELDIEGLSWDRPLLCFEGLSDPGNLGTILRTADHFDLGHVLLSEGSVDPYNPKAVRSSMGSLFRQRPHSLPLASTLKGLERSGRRIVLAEAQAPSVYSHPLPKDVALLFGSESQGLSQELSALAHESRSLPPLGPVESLNVAVSAALFCSELLRGEG